MGKFNLNMPKPESLHGKALGSTTVSSRMLLFLRSIEITCAGTHSRIARWLSPSPREQPTFFYIVCSPFTVVFVSCLFTSPACKCSDVEAMLNRRRSRSPEEEPPTYGSEENWEYQAWLECRSGGWSVNFFYCDYTTSIFTTWYYFPFKK